MKRIVKLSMVLTILASTVAYCQTDTTGWGRSSRFNRMFDSKTVTEISGEIIKMENVAPMRGMSTGIHMAINSEGKNYSVHLGPQWYLDSQSMNLRVKDKVTVKGSRITFEGSPAIIAMEIARGNEVLKLRNENGIPAWSGGRR